MMWQRPDEVENPQGLYLAGERVGPGKYRQVGTWREVILDREDFLPASCDGKVACYMLVNHTWDEIKLNSDLRPTVV